MEIPVSVKIWSTVYHLIGNGEENGDPEAVFIGWDEEEQPAVLPGSGHSARANDSVVSEAIRYQTDGVLTVNGSSVSVTYEESEDMGMEGCVSTISFDRRDPETVVMNRSGSAGATMSFCMREPRQYCVYDTGVAGFPLDLCIRSRRVNNGIGERGGVLLLDYVIEMRGVCTERTVLRMQIKPLPPEETVWQTI